MPQLQTYQRSLVARATDGARFFVISLAEYGTLRLDELKRNLGISQRMLSGTLKEQERDGLVNRTYDQTIPPKVE